MDIYRYFRKADTIVAYSYDAEVLCPTCTVEKMIRRGIASPAARDINEETVMEQCAGAMAIDRMDERTYDSGEFPKVVFASDDEDETCMNCGKEL